MSERSKKVALDFIGCFGEVAGVPKLWQKNHGDLMNFAENVRAAIAREDIEIVVLPRIGVAADIIVAMYASSVGAPGRIAAVNALLALKVFVMLNYAEAAMPNELSDKRMAPLLDRYRIDRGIAQKPVESGSKRRKTSDSSVTA